ncbi:MAG TPA: hypothetical protein DCP51_00600 [Clostridiales bacterium]|nr:hypothetical protein [Clostridiales bacterium]
MKKVDISELYDMLKSLSGSYILCFDIIHFMSINDNYGFSIGDIILAKTAKRIEKYLSDEMLLFRIGHDEFAVITGFYDVNHAKELSDKIINDNGKLETVGDNEIPLSLRVGIIRLPDKGINYEDVLQSMQTAINEERIKEG